MSYAKPLWNYAIDVYSENKLMFLQYQDQQSLCVNDLIGLGFCLLNQLQPNQPWWRIEYITSLRSIIVPLRDLRNKECAENIRTIILNTELECEKIDLSFIASQLEPSSNNLDIFNTYCHDHSINNTSQLRQFLKTLKHKKGS